MTEAQPWNPATATRIIREKAKSRQLTITYRLHARERLAERNIIVSDVLYALKNGDVYQDAVAATRPGYFRYRVECRTPNSGGRSVGVVVIPETSGCFIKIVTVMWVDEIERVAGSIVGED